MMLGMNKLPMVKRAQVLTLLVEDCHSGWGSLRDNSRSVRIQNASLPARRHCYSLNLPA